MCQKAWLLDCLNYLKNILYICVHLSILPRLTLDNFSHQWKSTDIGMVTKVEAVELSNISNVFS